MLFRKHTELPDQLYETVVLKPHRYIGFTITALFFPLSFFMFKATIGTVANGEAWYISAFSTIICLFFSLFAATGIYLSLSRKHHPHVTLDSKQINISRNIFQLEQTVLWQDIETISTRTFKVYGNRFEVIDLYTKNGKKAEIPYIFHKNMDYLLEKLKGYHKLYYRNESR